MELLNIEQAAAVLGTGPRFVRRLVDQRRIPFTKVGKHVRLDRADLEAFLAAGRVEPLPGRLVPRSGKLVAEGRP